MATMPRAATRTPPISVLRQTSNHAARLRRDIPLFETRRPSGGSFALIEGQSCPGKRNWLRTCDLVQPERSPWPGLARPPTSSSPELSGW